MKIVTVTVDRPLGSCHPQYPHTVYPVNYGYVKGVYAPDGEEQDAYILGVNEPVSEYTGLLAAVIRRSDDCEDKWVVIPENADITPAEIMNKTRFTEKYFSSEIIMLPRDAEVENHRSTEKTEGQK